MSLHNNSQFNTSSQNKSNINNSNTFNSNTIEKSFSDVNYEAKIQSLNGNVFKLSERLEKNMRKMASKEKELLFSNKKLKETEILNMRLMNELSLKNQSLENLNKDFLKKHHDIEKRLNSRIQNNDNKLDINPSNLFVKNLTDRIRKEYSKLANPNSKMNNYHFENVEIKLIISPIDSNANKDENCSINNIEIDLNGNEFLREVIQSTSKNGNNRCKSERGNKKFHSSKVDHSDMKISIFKD